MDREIGRQAIHAVSAYDPYTTYGIQDGKLLVARPGGRRLLAEQRAIILANRDAIVAYLTTPPPAGQCIRGHAVEWGISKYGDWLCKCYRLPATEAKTTPVTASNLPLLTRAN